MGCIGRFLQKVKWLDVFKNRGLQPMAYRPDPACRPVGVLAAFSGRVLCHALAGQWRVSSMLLLGSRKKQWQ